MVWPYPLLFPLTPEMETFAHIEKRQRVKNGCNLQKPGSVCRLNRWWWGNYCHAEPRISFENGWNTQFAIILMGWTEKPSFLPKGKYNMANLFENMYVLPYGVMSKLVFAMPILKIMFDSGVGSNPRQGTEFFFYFFGLQPPLQSINFKMFFGGHRFPPKNEWTNSTIPLWLRKFVMEEWLAVSSS